MQETLKTASKAFIKIPSKTFCQDLTRFFQEKQTRKSQDIDNPYIRSGARIRVGTLVNIVASECSLLIGISHFCEALLALIPTLGLVVHPNYL